MPLEHEATAWMLLFIGLLAGAGALLSAVAGKAGMPLMLLFILIGVGAGSEGFGGVYFDDHSLAFQLGSAALALILFAGGLHTDLKTLRRVLLPAGLLATVGVAGTAGIVACGARLLGWSWTEAGLLGAVVSSTDAAAVFSVLAGVPVQKRMAAMLEVESGLNDPMAVILTTALTQILVGGGHLGVSTALSIVWQLGAGAAYGLALGALGAFLLHRVRLPAGGLYPVFTVGIALIAFAAPTLIGASGFLAVYLAGAALGRGDVRFRAGVVRVHEGLAWLAQVGMFVLLGLLVFPSQLAPVAGQGLAIALLLGLVARPLSVALCLFPLGFSWREVVYLGWVGLRGAVPIVLAMFPVLVSASSGMRIFNLVFFVVALSAALHGGSARWITRRLRLVSDETHAETSVELTSTELLPGSVLNFHVGSASAARGRTVADLAFPEGSAVTLVLRGRSLVAPRGDVVFEEGDHVYVFATPDAKPEVELRFASA